MARERSIGEIRNMAGEGRGKPERGEKTGERKEASGTWRAKCRGAPQPRRNEWSRMGAPLLVRIRILACRDCRLASHTRPLSTTPSATPR
jgi:hypothetical protein